MSKKVLVTGASGFVGANLARRLLREGHQVHLLLRENHAGWRIRSIRQDVQVHVIDMADGEALKGLARSVKPDWIFHLAAEGAYPWQNDLNRIIATNIQATMNLASACVDAGFEAFIHTGSSSEYGAKDHAPREDELADPNSFYAAAKASATMFLRCLAIRHGLHITTLRLYSVYGPYEDPRRLVPALITNGRAGRYPPLVNPDVARDFVYSEDVCGACLLAAQNPAGGPGRVFNVGSGVQTRLRDIVEVARGYFQIALPPAWGSMENRNWDTHTWVADIGRIQAGLGWQPQVSLADGFAQTARWFEENQAILPDQPG
jgi:dolichol-phosphate mannosyltransferase